MKVTITALKAPWPTGAKVGDIVEFEGNTAPAWAVGKFTPAPDDAEAAHQYVPPEPPAESGPVLPSIGAVNLEVAELQARLIAAGEAYTALHAENGDLREQLTAAGERIKQLEAAAAKPSDIDTQAAAEKAAIEARQALVDEAKSLGLSFHPNTGDEKLQKLVNDAKAAKA